MGGVEGLAGLMLVGTSLARPAAPIVLVTQDDATFGMGAQGSLGLWVGGIKIDMHAVRAQIEMMGGKVERVAGGGLDRGDHAPGG